MAYSVGFVTQYIKSIIDQDVVLKNIEIEGETSNVSLAKNGILYFSLKDSEAILSCVMFSNDEKKLEKKLTNGEKISATGYITVYKGGGKYQLIVRNILRTGDGELYQRFLMLKDMLSERGMFDPMYKKPLPKYIKTLGVVTSSTGAAVRDIIKVTKKRNPCVSVIVAHALVQGEDAPISISMGIQALDAMGVDVIIVGRGGGSIEDLWAFNEEIVADAIFSSNTPIISAVGHETDTTISDYVADFRAPTPTAAAQMAVYDYEELLGELFNVNSRMYSAINRQMDLKRQKALYVEKQLSALSPRSILKNKRERLANYKIIMDKSIRTKLLAAREHIKRSATGLSALSPVSRLSQGYSYVTKDGKNIYKKSDVSPGDHVLIRVTDGEIKAEILEV